MKARFVVALVGLLFIASRSEAQGRVRVSGGDVARTPRVDRSRLSTRIAIVGPERRARTLVSGDSAQRIAMNDFEWSGRVSSVEIDEEDTRVFWDVKIVPDSSRRTIVRYRIDASDGGILSIGEFSGARHVVRRPAAAKP